MYFFLIIINYNKNDIVLIIINEIIIYILYAIFIKEKIFTSNKITNYIL